MSCFFIFDINPLLVLLFQIFSPIFIPFCSVNDFLCHAKYFKSHLFIFAFISFALDTLKKIAMIYLRVLCP